MSREELEADEANDPLLQFVRLLRAKTYEAGSASGSQTGGYEIFRQAGLEGSGPSPHYHPWDESFYVVRGNIAFGVGDKDVIALRR